MQIDFLESLKLRVRFGSVSLQLVLATSSGVAYHPHETQSLILYSYFWTKHSHPIPKFLVQDQTVHQNSKHKRQIEEYINYLRVFLVLDIVVITGDASQQ